MLAELGANADVVLLTPPVAGFDPDSRELSWAAADAVVCAVTPFGLTGPYRSWRATHLTSCALGGVMYSQGPPEGPPVVMPGRQLYDHAGTHVAIAVLAALRARPAVGGQFIDDLGARGAGVLPVRAAQVHQLCRTSCGAATTIPGWGACGPAGTA